MNISLNHLNTLLDYFIYDKAEKEHLIIYDLSDRNKVRSSLSNMSEKQYRYIIHLFMSKKWFKLKSILDNFLIKI
jgi:hypothetical protein